MVALPALWAGRDARDIIQIMSEAVSRVVAFDFCFIEVVLQAGDPEYALAWGRSGLPQSVPIDQWIMSSRMWATERIPVGKAFLAHTPLGQVRVLGLSMGFGTHGGKIWFGSRSATFPTYHQLALFRVATSLAATGLQAARINEEREQASRAKDEFLAMLAHELRNPLAPIAAAAELLTIAEPDRERVKKASAVITRQTRHMTSLIDDLLDVSRVTRGLIVLNKEDLDLSRVIVDAVEQARPLIDARNHRLVVHLPEHPIMVTGDFKRLVQVVGNLLNNAAKYTQPGGNIIVRLSEEEERASITVEDDGVGMSPDLIKRVFEMFAQAQRNADRSQGGLGIGLALVKSLVELHGGSVNAYSAGLAQGSIFSIQLQRIKLTYIHQHLDLLQPTHSPIRQRVMIVDDNVDAAYMLAKILETLGHEVHVEHNANAALEAADRLALNVFLLDIGLPDMDGYELARRLRESASTQTATIVAITGYAGEQDRKLTYEAGFDYHFAKPVNLDVLTTLLAEVPV